MAENDFFSFSKSMPAMESLAFRLIGAAYVTQFVIKGRSLPESLQIITHRLKVDQAARGAIQDIAYHTMRKLGMARFLLQKLTERPPKPEILSCLLLCALALLISDDDKTPLRYTPFTVVNQSVNAAISIPKIAKAKGFVNAILRRFLREKESLSQQINTNECAKWNYPAWWINRIKTTYPDHWQSILTVGNLPPPMTLRINSRRTSLKSYMALLKTHNIAADMIGPYAIRLMHPTTVDKIPGFMEGLVSVQDYAAQLAAPLLNLKDGMRVLDACAAPGGKSAHMLELANIHLTALDSEEKRLSMIHDNLERLGLFANIQQGDATQSDWWDGKLYDCILADVPCSASGVIRRHPDIRWLRRPEDSRKLAQLSCQILTNLWPKLKKGGKLLFATCSIWPEESTQQAEFFAFTQKAQRLDAFGQLLPTFNGLNDHDGLFYALFQKI